MHQCHWQWSMLRMLMLALPAPVAAQTPPPFAPLSNPPGFSFDTLGGMSFAHITKSIEFNASNLAWLSKYQVVQFDKGQDIRDMPNATTEDRFIHAARQIKKANPRVTTLSYLNGLIDFPAFRRIHNATLANPSLLLHNTAGKRVDTLAAFPGTFDVRQPAMRKVFVDDALYSISSKAFDGVFIDRANYASRVVIELKSGGKGQAHLEELGWDVTTAKSLVVGQTQLFVELTAALSATHIVLAKETGGGAPFVDWKVANAAMTTDTFCSNYLPKTPPSQKQPVALKNASCTAHGGWSPAVRGHVPLNGTTIWNGTNASTMAKCEELCCDAGDHCEAVLYNTQIRKCLLLHTAYTAVKYTCKNGSGVEWLSNKIAPGSTTCMYHPPAPAVAPEPNGTMWNATACREDMRTVAASASRQQMTESHGQGPLDDETQREFTMACFLVAAGNFSYFSYASWKSGEAWSLDGTMWWAEYDAKLGLPLDPPMMQQGAAIIGGGGGGGGGGDGMQYTRRFASGTKVELDLVRHTAKITWAR